MASGICSGPECNRPVRCRGVCRGHYKQLLKGDTLKKLRGERATCKAKGCEQLSHAKNLCPKHYARLRASGDYSTTSKETAESLQRRMRLAVKFCADCGALKRFCDFYKSEANRDGLTYMCKACMSESQAAWHSKNKEKNRDRAHRRRAIVRAGENLDLDLLWSESGGACPDCGCAIDRSTPYPEPGFGSIDHIVPVSRGGAHTQDNIRLVCLPCNIRKSNKMPVGTN